MKEYHKIQTLFKRNLTAPGKPMIEGDWTNAELEYLANLQWEFTEKIDGTNIRIDYRDYPAIVRFGGRTDNAQIPTKLLAYLQDTFTPTLFIEAELSNITLYGEGYGAGIQKGGGNYNPNGQEFVLFDVVVHGEDQDWWLDRSNVDDIAEKLGIKSVPVIGYGTLSDAVALVKGETRRRVVQWDEEKGLFQKLYVPGPLKSEWGNFEAEGIVARPVVQLFNRKGERIIAKIKGRDFK